MYCSLSKQSESFVLRWFKDPQIQGLLYINDLPVTVCSFLIIHVVSGFLTPTPPLLRFLDRKIIDEECELPCDFLTPLAENDDLLLFWTRLPTMIIN